MQLSNRAAQALDHLKAGARFRYGLTKTWHGREQFQWSMPGYKGYGGATFRELEKAGVEFKTHHSGFTGSVTYYSLRDET